MLDKYAPPSKEMQTIFVFSKAMNSVAACRDSEKLEKKKKPRGGGGGGGGGG